METPIPSQCDAREVAVEQRVQTRSAIANSALAVVLAILTMAGMVWKSGAEVATAQNRITSMEKWEETHLQASAISLSQLDNRLQRIEAAQDDQIKSLGRVEGALRVIVRSVK